MKLRGVLSIIIIAMIASLGGCKKDADVGIRPTVNSTNPINEATNTGLSSQVTATFSVAMDPAAVASSFSLHQGTTSVSGTVVSNGTTATFIPSGNLAASTVYSATITTGAKNADGNSLAHEYVWTFTSGATPDTAAPTIPTMNPANTTTAVATNHTIVVTFSEAMNAATITSSTFIVKQGSTIIPGTIVYTGTTAIFTPASPFEGNKTYTVTITTGVKDVAGNALAANTTSSFTTGNAPDVTLPTVNSTDPLGSSTGVARNKVISIGFSEGMDPLTITSSTFSVMQGTTPISGAVTYSGTTATFTPANLLAGSTTFIASISKGAKDLAGNALAAATTWSFTTSSATTGLAAVNLGAAGNYVILAKTAINNSSTSAITGDLGLSPAAESYVTGLSLTDATGYATSAQVTGKIFAADQAPPTPINLTTAVGDMILAYTDAAGRPTPDFSELGTGNIGGKILTAGLYKWSNTVTVPSDVTISGGATDVWIFQIAGNLTMSNAVHITLNGGALAKNIFWQVAGTATIGTTAHFEGIILSQTGITFQTGASMNGRALAQTSVILDSNAVTKPQ
jgi:Ice-binding-like/Bacterial Ig-like domain